MTFACELAQVRSLDDVLDGAQGSPQLARGETDGEVGRARHRQHDLVDRTFTIAAPVRHSIDPRR